VLARNVGPALIPDASATDQALSGYSTVVARLGPRAPLRRGLELWRSGISSDLPSEACSGAWDVGDDAVVPAHGMNIAACPHRIWNTSSMIHLVATDPTITLNDHQVSCVKIALFYANFLSDDDIRAYVEPGPIAVHVHAMTPELQGEIEAIMKCELRPM
jgi:hypothetical protein